MQKYTVTIKTQLAHRPQDKMGRDLVDWQQKIVEIEAKSPKEAVQKAVEDRGINNPVWREHGYFAACLDFTTDKDNYLTAFVR